MDIKARLRNKGFILSIIAFVDGCGSFAPTGKIEKTIVRLKAIIAQRLLVMVFLPLGIAKITVSSQLLH